MSKKGSRGAVKENLCRGCPECNKKEDPDKMHHCFAAQDVVSPIVVTFRPGEKCREKLCPHLRKIKAS